MTRGEWINEILIPWREGDVVEIWRGSENRWAISDDYLSCGDPITRGWPSTGQFSYRLKPRVMRWIVELPANYNTWNKHVAAILTCTHHEHMNPVKKDVIEAIRNAKPLKE